jgi:hypothetical protein
MNARAGPFESARGGDKARAYWIQFNIRENIAHGGFLDRTRIETILPEMPAAALLHVGILRESAMCVTECCRKRVGMFGYRQDVNVVRH